MKVTKRMRSAGLLVLVPLAVLFCLWQHKSTTRLVYKGDTLVGELTFTLHRLYFAQIVLAGVSFRVTNRAFMSTASHPAHAEQIPAYGRTSDLEPVTEHSGIGIGDLGAGNPCFQLGGGGIAPDGSWTWGDFYADPNDQIRCRLMVAYRHCRTDLGGRVISLDVREPKR